MAFSSAGSGCELVRQRAR